MKSRGVSAWLVTSEGTAPVTPGSHNIVEILDPRLPAERVREIVEVLYHRNALLQERIAWLIQKRHQPYPAEFVRIDGVRHTGHIFCGHNPLFHAQYVDNLTIDSDSDGRERPTYTVRQTVAQATAEFRKKFGPPR